MFVACIACTAVSVEKAKYSLLPEQGVPHNLKDTDHTKKISALSAHSPTDGHVMTWTSLLKSTQETNQFCCI
jgi:hypothetical protein